MPITAALLPAWGIHSKPGSTLWELVAATDQGGPQLGAGPLGHLGEESSGVNILY